jgi:hypothetical protein
VSRGCCCDRWERARRREPLGMCSTSGLRPRSTGAICRRPQW